MLAITFIACIGFALAIHEFVDVMHDELLSQTLKRELSSLVTDFRHGVPIAGHRWPYGHVYVSRSPQNDPHLPSVLKRLAGGERMVHDYRGHEYYLGRSDVNGTAVYLMIDTNEIEALEDRLAVLGWATLGVTIAIALLLSLFFSYLILRPVRQLSTRLSNYRPGQSNPPIAADYGDRDMREIAESFDALIARFDAAIAREKAFTEDASHELRTPLAVALGASELLDDMPDLDVRARGRVTRVRHACERMQRLVAALLFLARDPQRESEELSDAAVVLDDVLVDQHDAMTANRITLSLNVHSTPLPLPKGVVYSVLHNLIDNAVRHTKDAELAVEVTPERIRVVDAGRGMSAEVRNHIFERRYRTADSPGLGIGLYLVMRICDRQGWLIHVVSRPGQGTQIDIVLDPDIET
jgi:signal transduction histidine kinase